MTLWTVACQAPLSIGFSRQEYWSGLPFQVALVVKNLPANAGDIRDVDSIPGSLLPGGGHGNPLQYSFLESPMGQGAWQATVHKFAKLDATEAT